MEFNPFFYRIFLLCWIGSSVAFAQVVPLVGAHAHNDYNHDRPLLDALSNGFTSVEADVLLIDGELYVGHDLPEGTNDLPTLEEAYLLPLDSIIQVNAGFVFPGFTRDFYLMVDFKTEAEATYQVLKEQLLPYGKWLMPEENPQGRVNIFISGNRPIETILADKDRLVALDGRPEDLGKGYSVAEMPVISQAFYKYSDWDGIGKIPDLDKKNIEALVSATHKEGKMLRLWANPDTPGGWAAFRQLGVDIINTDNLEDLRNFLLSQ